ncbi:MAG: RNA polymerase sigma factor [Anaerolineae bacterium]
MTGSSGQSDDTLARLAQQGDRAALVELYRRYVGEVYGFAVNQLGSQQDAEDLTSETFMRLVSAIDTYQHRSSFRTWLYAIARNQLRDHWRRNGGVRTADLPRDLATENELPPARPEVTALGRHVLERLPDNYRRVVELRVLGDRSVRETAREMGTTEGNVKVLLHRALRRAHEIAGQWDDEQLRAE